MEIGQVCNRHVVHITKEDRVLEAARRMRDEHVGDLVVVDEREGRKVPVGILTDRDIVVTLVAKNIEYLGELYVGDILSRDLVTASDNEDVVDVLDRMRVQGIRRMPVVDASGALVGIFTLDDLIELLYRDLESVATLISREQRREIEQRL
jgi:CBS domain-containing protein